MHNKLGRDTTGIGDSNGAKGYAVPYDVVINSKGWGKKKERGTAGGMIVFSSNWSPGWSLTFLALMNICLLKGSIG